jgi:DNA repair exonuclease SbcCD ATPase subunit
MTLKDLKKDIEKILLLKPIYVKKGTSKRTNLAIETIHKRDELVSIAKKYADQKYKEGKKEGFKEEQDAQFERGHRLAQEYKHAINKQEEKGGDVWFCKKDEFWMRKGVRCPICSSKQPKKEPKHCPCCIPVTCKGIES